MMVEFFNMLSDEQIEFVLKEFGINKSALLSMSDDDSDDLYDSICDIEVDETMKAGDEELSERGKMASEIVTAIGNALAENEGWLESE